MHSVRNNIAHHLECQDAHLPHHDVDEAHQHVIASEEQEGRHAARAYHLQRARSDVQAWVWRNVAKH